MQLIDGKQLASTIQAEVATEIQQLPFTPAFAVILVGTDAASETYVALKEKAAKSVGIHAHIYRFDADCPDEQLLHCIRELNTNPAIHGILIQLPLPPGHDTDALIAEMNPAKDVDGFHPENVRALLASEATILSPVHEGVLRLIAATGIDARQKRVALIAKSDIFVTPLSYILKRAGFFVDRMAPQELDERALHAADVVIIAAGIPYLLNASMVKDSAIIIDVGITRLPDGRVVGDADAESFQQKNGWLTPVPGGVGPMTVALLLKNVVTLAKQQLH